jgi:hypothetical protein
MLSWDQVVTGDTGESGLRATGINGGLNPSVRDLPVIAAIGSQLAVQKTQRRNWVFRYETSFSKLQSALGASRGVDRSRRSGTWSAD